MNLLIGIQFIYGILLIGGGIIGYVHGSGRSLTAGLVFGVLALLSAIFFPRLPKLATVLAGLASSAMTLFFAWRLYQTHKFMPAGLLFALSACVFCSLWILRRQTR